jgi:PTS system galactitol-specific IIA component
LDLLEDFIISEENVIINLEAETYQEVIQKLGSVLFEGGFVKDTYIQAVLDREEIFPTGLEVRGGGIAIPHTDSEHVKKSTLGIATLAKNVDFKAMAEPDKIISVSIVMMLAVADKNKVVPVLTKIINILQNENAIIALNNATSKTEIKKIITEHINNQKDLQQD